MGMVDQNHRHVRHAGVAYDPLYFRRGFPTATMLKVNYFLKRRPPGRKTVEP